MSLLKTIWHTDPKEYRPTSIWSNNMLCLLMRYESQTWVERTSCSSHEHKQYVWRLLFYHWTLVEFLRCIVQKSPVKTLCVCVWPTHACTHSAWCKVVMHPDRSVTSCLECCSVDDGYHHCALCFALQPHRQAWFLTVTLCKENSLFTPANTYRSLIITINGCINGML